MKLKLVIILSFFLMSSFSTSGDEPVYYTSYKSNNGLLCHGIHDGDLYFYETYSGSETFYDNGTFDARIFGLHNTTIEIIEVDERSTLSSDFSYVYNTTYNNDNSSGTNFGLLGHLGSGNYFAYLDWTAWRNMYNNITQEHLEIISPSLDWNLYRYKATTQSDTIFSLRVFSIENNIQSMGTYNYNKSDGSLLSESYRSEMTNYEDKIFSSHWHEKHLISKLKVSEEILCPEAVSETTTTDESPMFNFIYFILLVPIMRIKSLSKKIDLRNNLLNS